MVSGFQSDFSRRNFYSCHILSHIDTSNSEFLTIKLVSVDHNFFPTHQRSAGQLPDCNFYFLIMDTEKRISDMYPRMSEENRYWTCVGYGHITFLSVCFLDSSIMPRTQDSTTTPTTPFYVALYNWRLQSNFKVVVLPLPIMRCCIGMCG